MLNKILFAAVLIWLASELVSWANPPVYQPQPQWHRVQAGETMWSIASDYFDEQDRYKTFDEWLYWFRKANEPQLRGKKYLPIGIVLDVPIEKEVKK